MNFEEAEGYLFSLGNEVETMKLGLENIRALLSALGNPQGKYLKVQVAGTNGKGSVCAFLESICLEAGIRTGLYTSPHLVSVRERVKINGADISEVEFAKHAVKVRETAESLVSAGRLESIPTFFEQMTALALVAFADANVELAILEAGLGGRYDATTAADAEVAVITRIDLDHQEYLGDTIEKIAAEKAAIIREDSVAVIIGEQFPEALKVIRGRCNEVGIQPSDEVYSPWTVSPSDPERVRVETTRYTFENIRLGLKGRHQIENAQTAIRIAQSLRYDLALSLDDEQIVEGLEKADHPGRLEFSGGLLLDGAHNVAGATALRAYLAEYVDRPITLIFGAMKDKSVREILRVLAPLAEVIVLTTPDSPRAMRASELAKLVPPNFPSERVILTAAVDEAIAAASRRVEGGLMLVTGSLYLIGEVKKILAERPDLRSEI